MKASSLANGGKKENRRALDFYPTPPDVTHALMDKLHVPINYRIWDCAGGDGAMVNVFKELRYYAYGTDIRDGVDFLSLSKPPEDCEVIITNPPFKDSQAFIEHALRMPGVKLVAMLLKSQYWHAKKRHKLFIDYPPNEVLPLTWRPDFMGGERGGSPTMDVLWTVWDAEWGTYGNTYYCPLTRKETK